MGLLKNYTFSNGQTTTLTYDNRRALTTKVSGVSNLGFTYADPRGNLTAVNDILTPSNNKTFIYDEASRLKNYNSSWGGGRFDYQVNSNRSQKVLGTAVPYQYSNSDRLTSAGKAFAYNGDGEMTSMGDLGFDYNAFHRLRQVRKNGSVIAGYGYDANGLRINKTGDETKIYLNGPDGNVLSELDGSGNTIADYVYLNGTLVAKAVKPDHTPVIAPWLLLLLHDK